MQPPRKGFGWRIWDAYHLLHAGVAAAIAFGAVYLFFSEEGMSWQIDLITAAFMAPFVAIAVIVYKVMFRKKSQGGPLASGPQSPKDPIQQSRDSAR